MIRTGLFPRRDIPTQLVNDIGKRAFVHNLLVARTFELHLSVDQDSTGTGAHNQDAVGEKDSLAKVVGNEHRSKHFPPESITHHSSSRVNASVHRRAHRHQKLGLVDECAARDARCCIPPELPEIYRQPLQGQPRQEVPLLYQIVLTLGPNERR